MTDAKDQLNQWLGSSRACLNEAKVIGLNANLILKKFKVLLDGNNLLILKINYMIVFLKGQIGLMNRIFKNLQSFNKKYQLKFLKNLNYLNELINQLNHSLTNLNSILIDNNIKLFIHKRRRSEDGALSKSDSKGTEQQQQKDEAAFAQINSLYDYLSLEEFLKIQQNFEMLRDNYQNLNNYLVSNQLNFFEINLFSFDNFFQNLLNEFNNINNYFYKDLVELNLYSNDNGNPNLCSNEKYSILINYYEFEMASLLHSLTNHYDQCNEAIQLYNNKQHAELKELTQILAGDSSEAPNVLNDLKLLYLKIEKLNSNNNLHHLNVGLNRIYDELIVNNFVVNDFLQKTNRNLNISVTAKNLDELNFNFLKKSYLKLNDDMNVLNLDVLANINLILKFLEFLKNFESNYFGLILEIDRNREVNVKVKKLIKHITSKLNDIENESSQKSAYVNKILKKYLPSDLSTIVNNDTLHKRNIAENNIGDKWSYEGGSGKGSEKRKSSENEERKINVEKNSTLPIVKIISEFTEFPELEQSLVEFARLKLGGGKG